MKKYRTVLLIMAFLWPAVATAQQEKAIAKNAQVDNLPRVHFINGSGTLSRGPKDRLEYLRYSITGERLTGQQLIEMIPEVSRFARVTIDSENFLPTATAENLKALSLRMNAALKEPDTAGLVFSIGTNTIEEIAYFMNLTIKSDKPVVIVGSQRPFTALSSDGPLNLLNAIRVAASPASIGKGVLVLLNDEINAAREVTKTNTYRVETFQSRDMGLLGYADPDKIVYYRTPTKKHTFQTEFDLTQIKSMPRVDIIYAHSGNDGELAKAAVAVGAKGLVIAGTGAGHTQNARQVLKELCEKQKVLIVRSSRVGAGRVVREDNYQEPGFVAADNLNAQKARILLQLALTKTTNPGEIQRSHEWTERVLRTDDHRPG